MCDGFRNLPFLDLVMANYLELSPIIIDAIFRHNLHAVLDLFTILWKTQTLNLKFKVRKNY